VPGSGRAINVYHIPGPLLTDLVGPSVLAWLDINRQAQQRAPLKFAEDNDDDNDDDDDDDDDDDK
jgi:hypothetical protein